MNLGEHNGSIHKRLRQVERVLDQANVDGFPRKVRQDDFDDIEPEADAGIVEEPEIFECDPAHVFLFFFCDRFARGAVVVGPSGFNFHESEPVALSANNVNLTSACLEAAHQNAVALTAEITGRKFFAALAQRHPGGGVDGKFAQPVPSHAGTLTGRTGFNKPNRR